MSLSLSLLLTWDQQKTQIEMKHRQIKNLGDTFSCANLKKEVSDVKRRFWHPVRKGNQARNSDSGFNKNCCTFSFF